MNSLDGEGGGHGGGLRDPRRRHAADEPGLDHAEPAGHRHDAAEQRRQRVDEDQLEQRQRRPVGVQRGLERQREQHLRGEVAAEQLERLAGAVGDEPQVVAGGHELRPDLGARPGGAGGAPRSTAPSPTPTAITSAITQPERRRSSWCSIDDDEVVLADVVKFDAVNTNATTTRMTSTTMAASVLSTPELTATAAPRPCFWKKRITTAVVPTVPATMPVNWLANCTPVAGPSGRRVETEPEHGDGLGELGQLREHGHDHDPSPDDPGEDVAHAGHVGELADEQVDAEDRAGRHQQVGRRDPRPAWPARSARCR